MAAILAGIRTQHLTLRVYNDNHIPPCLNTSIITLSVNEMQHF
jgi:hypothetical protein